MKETKILCLLMLGVITTSMTTGCGKGASTKPTVTAKPRDDGSQSDTNVDTAKSNGKNVAAAGGVGNFKGVIKFDGTPPDMGLLAANKDAICIANKDKIENQTLVVNKTNKGIQNVFIYLAKKPKGAVVAPAPEEPDTFDQKFCEFVPHAKIVRVGRTLNVLNDDATLHNTHSFPLSPRNSPGFNQSVSPNNRTGVPMLFKGSERLPVAVKCDIHGWMTAWILPLDHDFAAVTDENGEFEIKGLPAGEHEFVIWQEKAGYLNRKFKVVIQAEQTEDQTLTFNIKP